MIDEVEPCFSNFVLLYWDIWMNYMCVCVIFWMRVRWVRSGCKNEEVDNGVDDGDWFIKLIMC